MTLKWACNGVCGCVGVRVFKGNIHIYILKYVYLYISINIIYKQ